MQQKEILFTNLASANTIFGMSAERGKFICVLFLYVLQAAEGFGATAQRP